MPPPASTPVDGVRMTARAVSVPSAVAIRTDFPDQSIAVAGHWKAIGTPAPWRTTSAPKPSSTGQFSPVSR